MITSGGTIWAFLLNGISFLVVLVSLSFLLIVDLQVNARARLTRGSVTKESAIRVPSGFESHPGHVVSHRHF